MAALHLRTEVLPLGEVRDVYVVDGRFTFIAPDDAETVHVGGFALPGLVDAHAHLALSSPAADDADEAARVQASLLAQLEAGVLLVREPGGPGYASREVDSDALPEVRTAGRMLARTGRYFPGLGREVEPDALVAAAAEELGLSRGPWVKVIADFFEPGGRITPAWPAGLMRDVVARVHELGGRVAAHATCRAALEDAIEAGVDSIEHGVGLAPAHLPAMAASGTVLVPTLLIRPGVLDLAQRFGADEHACAHLDSDFDGLAEVIAAAPSHGVIVLAGTDAGLVPHGLVAAEMALLQACGLTHAQAAAAGSWAARDYLGLPGIEEGAVADLVLLDDDPREDVSSLGRVRLVMRAGRIATRR